MEDEPERDSNRGAPEDRKSASSSDTEKHIGHSVDKGRNIPPNIRDSIPERHAITDERKRSASSHSKNEARTFSIAENDRHVEWFTDVLHQYLQKIVAKRGTSSTTDREQLPNVTSQHSKQRHELLTNIHVVTEVAEVIDMPDFDEHSVEKTVDTNLIQLGEAVADQLKSFVGGIAASYRHNAFHNFEHASHVAWSASRILNEILGHSNDRQNDDGEKPAKRSKCDSLSEKEIHNATFGISSDPLMHFALLFAALIHDVDHSGLTNQQLINRHDSLALKYLGRSVAEQHSIACAWEALMADQYADLQKCIYQTDDERIRFRQLVINAVIATDIADAKLQRWRKKCWIEAFQDNTEEGNPKFQSKEVTGRRALLLFELIIQTSDSAHTMQRWQTYQKWNRKLFDERYRAFVEGKDDIDPSLSWYRDELLFFDNYVIPLARSFKQCPVFESLCAEFVNFALGNRQEWQEKGEKIVVEMVANFIGKSESQG